jgi:hypothetical protein
MNASQPGVSDHLKFENYRSIQEGRKLRWLVYCLFSAVLLGYQFGQLDVIAAEFDECGIESSIAFEDWRQWAKTTPTPYFSREHGNRWVTIYFDDPAGTADQSTNGEFAVCTKIIKVHFTDESGASPRKLFQMAKMPAGFDPEHGDWWYGNYNATAGAAMIEQGVVEACINCHQRASGTDYVFFKGQIQNSMK